MHDTYMRRCFELAELGGNAVKSNPYVGSVIVHNGVIIGEGYHKEYGKNHAERNALENVPKEQRHLIPKSTIYVSLEPCNHTGKTPPCVDAILENEIKEVYISCLDPNPLMSGKSVQLLRDHGITVHTGILKDEGQKIISRFKKNLSGKPFTTIKFAQSYDRYIGKRGKSVAISGNDTQLYSHKLRSEHDAILIGTETAIVDNPKLNCRAYPGSNPIRIILDRTERIPKTHHIFQDEIKSIFLTSEVQYNPLGKEMVIIENWDLNFILKTLYSYGICSLMVEGGAKIIKWFVQERLWDEAHVYTSQIAIESGIRAPRISGNLIHSIDFDNDIVHYIEPFSRDE